MSVTKGIARLLQKRENPAWPVIFSDSAGFSENLEPVDQDFDNYLKTVGTFPTVAASVNKLVALALAVDVFQGDLSTGERLEAPRLRNRNGEDLLRKPNPGEGSRFFFAKGYQQLALTGNLYHNTFPTMQSPNELWVLESEAMHPRLSQSNQYPFAGFTYQGSRRKERIDPDTVIFTRRPHPRDKIFGMGFPYECADALELLWRSRRLNNALLKRGGRTGGFLQIKGGLAKPERDRIKQEIQSRFTVDGSGKVVVLGAEDASFTPDTSPPRDLEHQTTITEAKLEVYNVFGFMPALFSTRDVNRSNLREAKASAYEDAVIPFVELMLEQWNNSPMATAAGVQVLADWASVPALQPNQAEMASAAAILLDRQVATPNEIAAWFGLAAKEWGDEPSRPPIAWVTGLPPPGAEVEEQLELKSELAQAEAGAKAGPGGNGNGDEERGGGHPLGPSLDLMAPQRALRLLSRFHGGGPDSLRRLANGLGPAPRPRRRENGAPAASDEFERRVAEELLRLDVKTCAVPGGDRDWGDDPDRAALRRRAGDRQEKVENRWVRELMFLFRAQEDEVLANVRERAQALEPRAVAIGMVAVRQEEPPIPPAWGDLDWFDDVEAERQWNETLLPFGEEAFREGAENAGEVLEGLVEDFALDLESEALRDFVANELAKKVTGMTATGTDRVASIVKSAAEDLATVGELEQRLQEEFRFARRVRSRWIARTETAGLFDAGGEEAMVQNGVTHNSWLSSRDTKVRGAHRAIDGQIRRVGENFEMENPDTGEKSYGPGPGRMDRAWASIQCRCSRTPELNVGGSQS